MSIIRRDDAYYEPERIAKFARNELDGKPSKMPDLYRGINLRRILRIIRQARSNTIVLPVEAAQLVDASPADRATLLQGVTLGRITEPTVILDQNRVPLVYYLPGIFSEAVEDTVLSGAGALETIYKDKGWRADPTLLVHGMGAAPRACPPPKASRSLRLNPTPSSEWLKLTKSIRLAVDIVLGIIHPQSYFQANQAKKKMGQEVDPETKGWLDLWETVYTAIAAISNRSCIPHIDSKGPRRHFDALVNAGNADVVLDMPDLRAHFPYLKVYLDDILIYSDSLEEHKKTVKEVLRRLRANKLYAKGEKCEFHADTVEYLGYILSPDGLKMSEDKIKVIQDWPEPRKVKDVQSFLGKGVKWEFNPASKAAFEKLKHRPMVIETDASDYALGAIFSIYTDDGEIHPVAFHSRTFANAELNYDVHDKELLAIHEAFKVWSRYLDGSGSPIDVFTDHKNLEYFTTTKILTRRQARWSEFLSQFNFTIHYRPGRLGAKPDTLTRRWDMYPKEGENSYAKVNPQNLRPIFNAEQMRSSLRATALWHPVMRGSMIMNTDKLHEDIKAAYSRDSDLSKPVGELGPRWSLDAAGFIRLDGRIYVPNADDLRLRILQNKHDHILAGHPGQTKTLALIRREYVWPNLRSFVIDYCKSCVTCMRAKPQRHKPYGLLRQLPVPSRPWDSISMDFIEKLPPSLGFDSILVVVDRLSKQGVFISCHDTITSEGLAKLFVMHIFSKHGVPQHVTSDRGSEFVSRFFQSLGKALKIELHFTSGYHPEGDGQTERTNQTLEQYLRIYCNYQQDNWAELLPLAEFAYNNAPHSTIGVSPFFANKGYNPSIAVQAGLDLSSPRAQTYVSNLEDVHAELRRTMAEAQARYQGPADKRRSPQPDFKVGDEVFLKSKFFKVTRPLKKLADKNLGPYKILERVGYSSFLVQLPDNFKGVHPVFHVSMMEPHTQNTIPNREPPPPPPIAVDASLEYEVKAILDSKWDRRKKKCPLHYLVEWEGYANTAEATTWEPANAVANAKEAVADFHHLNPGKPGPSWHPP
ncbi:hypothetical protein ONZ45_g10598 [Pleurotus djamor]|nr:hypothetical protein ONZ45_g10598 [Pleurotus djamor]